MALKPYAATLLGLIVSLVVGSCATRIDIGGADTSMTPQQVASDPSTAVQRTVAWGGAIVAIRNLREQTEIEILAYPLDYQNQPNIAAPPTGRFVGIYPGYLESVDYAPGRLITLVGTVAGTRDGTVGDARYIYPLITISRQYLWSRPAASGSEPRVQFGIGIGISR